MVEQQVSRLLKMGGASLPGSAGKSPVLMSKSETQQKMEVNTMYEFIYENAETVERKIFYKRNRLFVPELGGNLFLVCCEYID